MTKSALYHLHLLCLKSIKNGRHFMSVNVPLLGKPFPGNGWKVVVLKISSGGQKGKEEKWSCGHFRAKKQRKRAQNLPFIICSLSIQCTRPKDPRHQNRNHHNEIRPSPCFFVRCSEAPTWFALLWWSNPTWMKTDDIQLVAGTW